LKVLETSKSYYALTDPCLQQHDGWIKYEAKEEGLTPHQI
jgi:hypothetical protein